MKQSQAFCSVHRDKNLHQELLMFCFQWQCKAIDDTRGKKRQERVKKSLFPPKKLPYSHPGGVVGQQPAEFCPSRASVL